jgi:hypothetical protein
MPRGLFLSRKPRIGNRCADAIPGLRSYCERFKDHAHELSGSLDFVILHSWDVIQRHVAAPHFVDCTQHQLSR